MANKKNNSDLDLNRLDRFIHRISGTRETPALIQMVAGSGEWMEFTRELINLAPESDPELGRQFRRACQRRKLDPDKLMARLVPVAQSLGLSIYGSQQQDYYTLLGIDPSASPDDIRKAYHRKAKSLHPDTRKDDGDDRAFIQLADGYQVLEDPVLRAHYDQSRESLDAWCEGPACLDENEDSPDRRSRRNRYILQLSGVVVLMIFVALVFNVIYESRSISDGYYAAPESLKTVSDSDEEETVVNKSESEIVEKSREADRPVDRLKKDATKGESAAPAASVRATGISSRRVDRKPKRDSSGVSRSSRKQIAGIDPGIDTDPGIGKVAAKKPENRGREPSLIKPKETQPVENMKDSPTIPKRVVAPPVQTGSEMKTEKKKASALLRKFAEEESEIKRINAFIRKYSETYEKGDYSEFSRLFTEDATENGTAFLELAPDYRRTFTTKEKLEFDIELHKTSLFVDQDVIRTEGIYRIAWQPYNGARKKSEGSISFEIVKRSGEYRVQKLEYGRIKPK